MAFILIVDASACAARRAADVLTAAGHSCGWVSDAGQARTLLLWRCPDLILLDVDVSDLAPEALLDDLAAAGRDVPLVMLSETEGAGDGIGKIAHGARDCIRKPFDPRFLVWRVNHALEVHAARSPARPANEQRTAPAAPGPTRDPLRSLA